MAWLITNGNYWRRRVKLTFSGWGAGDDVNGYPVYVELDSSDTDFWDVITDDRDDVRFTDVDGTTELKHFLLDSTIGFDHTADDMRAFVRVPKIDVATDYIYMYWSLLGGAPASVEDEEATFTPTILGYELAYLFDQTVGHFHDSSGVGNDSVNESGILRNQTGLVGKSIYCDGSNDYVYTPNVYGTQSFTVVLLVKPTNASADRCVFSLYTDSDNYMHVYTHHTTPGTGRIEAEFEATGAVTRDFTITNNVWNIISIRKTVSSLEVSVNGGGYLTQAITSVSGIDFDHMYLGCKYTGSKSDYWQGYLDMVWVTDGNMNDYWNTTNNDNFKELDLWTWTTASLDGIPSPPTSPECEGATNPQTVYDRTPEFTAIYDDVNTSDVAKYYEIEVDDDVAFGSPAWDTGKLSMANLAENSRSSEVSYAGDTIVPNTTYYWRIRFWDSVDGRGEWSATQNFKCPNSAPTAPTSLETEGATDPVNVYDRTPEFTALYNDPDTTDNAEDYRIQVDDDGGFGSILWDSTKTALGTPVAKGGRCEEISYAGSALSPNTTYYWRIKFWDDDDVEGAWSAGTDTFYCPNSAPSAPTTLLTNGLADPATLQDYTPYFSAIVADAESGNGDTMVYYQLQVDDDGGFGSTLWDSTKTAFSVQPDHSERCENIEYGGSTPIKATLYYWRIKFWDDDDAEGTWSASGEFTIINSAPTAPTTLWAEGETNPSWVTDSTPEFNAIGHDIDPADQMDFIAIEVDTDPEFGSPIWNSGKSAITAFNDGDRCAEVSYAGDTLIDDVKYYWRIKFWDDDGAGTQGAWSSETAYFIKRSGTGPTEHRITIKDCVSSDEVELTGDSVADPFVVESIDISPLTMRTSRVLGGDPELQYEDREFDIKFSILDKDDDNSPDDVLDSIATIRRLLSTAERASGAGDELFVRLEIWPANAEYPSYWPIKRGWLTGYDPVDDIIATTGEANSLMLHLITTPWGRGVDLDGTWILARMKGGDQSSFTTSPATLYNHDDEGIAGLVNGDMELDSNWSDSAVAPTTNERSAEQIHGGSYSRKLVSGGTNRGMVSDAFTSVTDTVYIITLWVYPVDKDSMRTYWFRGSGSGGDAQTDSNLTLGQWNKITWEYTETAGGASANLQLDSGLAGNGTWYFDDVVITIVGHDNFIDIPTGDIQGDVSAMVELEILNHASSSDDIYQIHISHKDGSDSDSFVPMLIAEDAAMGSDTSLADDATAPGLEGSGGVGQRADCDFSGTATMATRLTWTIAAGLVEAYRGTFRIYACAFMSAASTINARMMLSLGTGHALYGTAKPLVYFTSWPIVDMGIFKFPPEFISRFEDNPAITINLQTERTSGSATMRVAYILLFPLEWPDNYLLGQAVDSSQLADQSEYIMHLSDIGRERLFIEESGRTFQHTMRAIGQSMYLRPYQKHRIFFHRGMIDGSNVRHNITERVTVRVRHNPRFSLSRS